MLTLGLSFSEPYFISDDIQYEELVKNYLLYAKFPIDVDAFDKIGAGGYLQVFWPWVICVTGYITQFVYAGRIVNVILSVLSIREVYNLTYNLSKRSETALFSAKVFAYLPLLVISCCFPIKDIFLMFAMLRIFNLLLVVINSGTLSVKEVIICAFLAFCIYWTRGAVIEVIAIFFCCAILFSRNRSIWVKCVLFTFCLVLLYTWSNSILNSFDTKIEDYRDYALMDTTISNIQMKNITEIYKWPLSYLFATVQPMTTKLFSPSINFWYGVLCYANLTVYPFAIANFLYIFDKKHNLLFWLLTTIMYTAVFSLSLGIFRHYLFLFPLVIVNCSLYFENKTKRRVQRIKVGVIILASFIIIYSFI